MATNTILRPKTHAEWLALRAEGIGSSEVATILYLNPFQTPYQLWRIKKGIDPPKTENFAMRAGHYLEDAVSRFYADATGNQIIKRSATDWIIRDKSRPYLQVSPDRTFWLPDRPHNNANKGILECKTTQMSVDDTDIPQHWLCQLQYQLGVAGLEQGALAWLTQGRDFGYAPIEFDPEFFAYIVEEVERFWTDNILGNQEPAAINVDDILLRNPRHVPGKSVEADNELAEQCEELKALQGRLSSMNDRKKEIEGEIKMAMGDAESLTWLSESGYMKPLATWKTARDSQKFDEKRFKSEHPDLWSQYQYTQRGSRRFIVK